MASLRHSRWCVVVLVAVLSSACGGRALRWEPRVHVVVAGETLQAIAFRYHLDVAELATWNRLDNPDIIFAGQRLVLSAPTAGATRVAAPSSRPAAATSAQASRDTPVAATAPAAGDGNDSGAATAAGMPAPARWQWPADGAVIAGFGSATSLGRGIDLKGNQGDPVVAAAPGRVVYSGSGLLGYGNLIILKHNDTYLSAYGHNDTLLVGEGEQVRAGQRIATMGLGPGDRAVLHFEIRQKGKPVDPLRYLPKR